MNKQVQKILNPMYLGLVALILAGASPCFGEEFKSLIIQFNNQSEKAFTDSWTPTKSALSVYSEINVLNDKHGFENARSLWRGEYAGLKTYMHFVFQGHTVKEEWTQ